MRFVFHPEALNEVEEAAEFYSLRQPGLELRFLDAINKAVENVLASPQRFRSLEAGYIFIIAVMHCHCSPDYWKKRL